mmetsp:Transcript_16665/g.28260  ORF Transcript_16665/g.28260 Transcript_16665/m.28260 type:complete len:211 (-) Transcript_16665:313-945(-)
MHPKDQMSAEVSYFDPISTSGALYCRVWMSSLKCLWVQQAFPRSTTTARLRCIMATSVRSGWKEARAIAVFVDDIPPSERGAAILPPSLKLGFTGWTLAFFLSPTPGMVVSSDDKSTPMNARTLSWIGLRAFHQLVTFSKFGPTSSNECAPSSPAVGRAEKSLTNRRSKPKMQVPTELDNDGSRPSSMIFIAKGWSQIIPAFLPKTIESS